MTPSTNMSEAGVRVSGGRLRLPPSLQRNVLSNWTATATSVIYSLCITPIVVSALERDLYGIWSFLNGLLAYSNLLYLGLGSALIRYAAQYRAAGDQSAINRLASVVLSLYGTMGAICLACSVLLAPHVPSLLKIVLQPDSAWAVIATCVLLGVRLLFMFIGSVFSGLLVAEGRADVYNLVGIAGTLVRFVAVPLLIGRTNPLLMLAFIVTASAGLETAALMHLAHAVDPRLRGRLARPRPPELRLLYGFGLLSFLIQLSERLISYTDTTVIGLMLGAASVALYSLPLQLAEYTRIAVWGIVSVLLPHLTALHTRGDLTGLREAYLRTTRLCCFVSAFANVNLIFLGAPFLSLWVGPQFAQPAGWVLLFLGCASFFQALSTQAQIPFYQTLRLMRFPVLILALEALTNLLLSIRLAPVLGINGVALGTVIPSCFISFAILPRYVCARLGVPFRRLLTETLLPSALLVATAASLQATLDLVIPPTSYALIFVRALATVPLALAIVAVSFPREDRLLAASTVKALGAHLAHIAGASRSDD